MKWRTALANLPGAFGLSKKDSAPVLKMPTSAQLRAVGKSRKKSVVRPKSMWKSRRLVSGVSVWMGKVSRPIPQQPDTRPRDDGHDNCPDCHHNRFKIKRKVAGVINEVQCRYCGAILEV